MADGAAAPQLPTRVLDLPGGRHLVVRPLRTDDGPALVELYRGLGTDDRYRRFFSACGPSEPAVQRLLGIAERGGFGLVAVPGDDPGAAGPIVAEATCARLANGDGELGIAIADDWRGWLGPYLLDLLLTTAAELGMPNVEADILTENAGMLSLARSRGYATMDHEDWSVVRVVMSTTGRTPSWPGSHDRPRLLVETPGGRWQGEAEARAAGLQVVVCPGPAARRGRCPALLGETCPLVAGADAVFVVRPPGDGGWSELPAAHLAAHPGVPVCIQPRVGAAGAAGVAAAQPPTGVVVVPAGEERAVLELAREAAALQPGRGDERPEDQRSSDPGPATPASS